MEWTKWSISDSELERNHWRFPKQPAGFKIRKLLPLDEEDFLVNHKIDRSYDDSTVRFKLLFGKAISANLQEATGLPGSKELLDVVKKEGWVSEEFEHLWRRDNGGSAILCTGASRSTLTFLLQTPRDGRSFCSLSLVNRDVHYCAGMYVADERYKLDVILSDQEYHNRHPKVPRDFAVLPISILCTHVEETLGHVQGLARDVTSTEKRIAEGDINLEKNGDYKLLNRLNSEHIRLLRRSDFELELVRNLLKYFDEYHRIWAPRFEGGTSYVDDMREKIKQQQRYSEQVQRDLEILPRRLKNLSKAIFNFVVQRDNKLNIQLAESNKRIAEEARRDNMLNLEMAAATAQVAEETRQDSAAMKTIAVLTLTFLPGTAVASFFSMTMFQWPFANSDTIASPYIYVYFVVTIPLTVMVYAVWVWWFKYSQKHYKKMHEEGLSKFEHELKLRMRSATMSPTQTW